VGKRKLTKQQAWRIQKIQDERSKRSQKRDDKADELLVGGELGDEQEGLIISHFGTQVEVEGANGERQRCFIRANLPALVTGDRVVFCAGEYAGVVVALHERQTILKRPDPYTGLKPVAANIDQVVVVIAPQPTPYADLIDRYLVAAETAGIEPLLLLNKTDLLDQPELKDTVDEVLEPYKVLGYRVVQTSANRADLSALVEVLQDRVSVFVGQSGVGKSSLVNSLLPAAALRTSELSQYNQKGQHTTTTARLFHLPTGGVLIDSPGIREFGLWHMSRAELEQGFREFAPFLGACRFRDCKHEAEPDCALIAAVGEGRISEARFRSYQILVDALDADRPV
jgi:ribosome biogenesis GTPase